MEFTLGDKVFAIGGEVSGEVVGIWLSTGSIPQYYVRYLDDNGCIRTDWLYGSELSKTQS